MKLSKSAVNHRLRRLQEVADAMPEASAPNPARRSA
jgi:DNA-binding transcriptional regulator WhiA